MTDERDPIHRDFAPGTAPAQLSRRAFVAAAGIGATAAALGERAVVGSPARAEEPVAEATRAHQVKSIYLAKRNPKFTHDQFVIRWREHGALAMSQSFFAKHIHLYVQSEVIEPAPLPGAATEYDAVAYLMQTPEPHSAEEVAELGRMVEDEYETFSGPILPVVMQTEERVLTPGAPGGVTAFLFFTDPEKAERVANAYHEAGSATRVALNLRLDFGVEGMSVDLPFPAVAEVSAPSLEGLRVVLGGAGDAWREADVAAITRECVMWDRLA